MVGNVVDWPVDTLECQGATGMLHCLKEHPGAIGYISSTSITSEGSTEGLEEVQLQNQNGRYLTSEESSQRGGFEPLTSRETLSLSFDEDWSTIDFLNQVRHEAQKTKIV